MSAVYDSCFGSSFCYADLFVIQSIFE